MPNSLRAKLSSLRYKGKITEEEYKDLISKLDGHDKAIMAIKALEQTEPEKHGDCISRNAIIETLNEMDRFVANELTLCKSNNKFPQNEVFIVDDVYEQIAEELPSVEPERKPGKWIVRHTDIHIFTYCSNCGADGELTWHYCPSCGAKMRG